MYPLHFFSLFPPFPRTNKIFIAMSFQAGFEGRWQNVIAPAIRRIGIDGRRLEPSRVDVRQVSDSILTDILTGLSESLLVFADVSALNDDVGNPIRNANVMYEVGLAHAIRLPEEVLLFRSDASPLLFDVAAIRVNRYDPEGSPDEAIRRIQQAVIGALKEVQLQRSLAVRRAAEALDLPGYWVLLEAAHAHVKHPTMRTVGETLAGTARIGAIPRLLESGMLMAELSKVTPEMVAHMDGFPGEEVLHYRITPFGQAVLSFCASQAGILEPDVWRLLEEKFGTENADAKMGEAAQ